MARSQTTAKQNHTDEDKQAIDEFKDLVNMTPKSLEHWLNTDESKGVGQKRDGASESTGHHMGGEIVELLGKAQSEYDANDVKCMHKVTGYIKRHMAQRPDGDVTDIPWRRSLMNWGHDPLKK